MSKRRIPMTLLAVLCMLSLALVGCGGGGGDDQADQAGPSSDEPTVAAVHDCAGPCGMTDVPEAQLTKVDGKWYCGGCVVKAQEEAAKKAGHDHEG